MRARIGAMAGAAAFVAGTALCQVLPAGSVANSPSTDLRTYALFGFTSLNFKGAEAAGRGVVSGGNVGTNGPGNSHDPSLNICNNHPAVMDPGSQLVGNRVAASNLGGACKIYDLFANVVQRGRDPLVVQPGGSGPSAYGAPLTLTHVPSFTVPSCRGNDVTVPANGSRTLSPGTLGNLIFR
ncbi:MAG TPA: hypothetical protein VN636_16655, partial [Acidimicrobiia bacterium]|nr:hypothetical protein [Acidimicrobiia bacterium]